MKHQPRNINENKRCSRCNNYYPESNFRKNKYSPDGLSWWCKKCANDVNHKYYESNKDNILKKGKEYRLKNLDLIRERAREKSKRTKERNSSYLKEYYKIHKEDFKLHSQKYYQEHKNEIKERVRLYSKNNPKKVQVHTENKRARKFGLGDRITMDEWNNLLDFYGHRCLKCGAIGVKLTQDHIIPLSKGGRNLISNIQPLCISCNSSKHTDIVDYR